MVQVTETKTFALQGWAGGLNSENQRHLRAPDEAEISDYNLGPRGEVVVRLGLDRLAAHDTWTGGNVRLTSLFPYTPDAGATRYLIAVDLDGKVWRTNAGPGSTISACLSAGVGNPQVDLGATTIVSDATTLGGYFVLTREDGHAWKWDGSGGATWVEITDHALDDNGVEGTWEFPICSTVCSAFSRVWAAGNDSYPSRLFWSGAMGTVSAGTGAAAGPWNWPSTNWVDINPEDGGEITKIYPFGQAIIVFKNNSLYAFVGAGDPTSARLYPIHGGVGCIMPATVAESTGRLFWASTDGVYQYDGSGVVRIDEKVRSAIATLAGLTYRMYASGYAVGERYHLHFPSLTAGLSYRYTYDTEGKRWEVHTDGGWGSALVFDVPYVTRWGGIFLLETHAYYDDTYAANGTASTPSVPATFKTSWLPPPDQRTGSQYRVRRIDLYLERPTVSASAPCKYRVRLWKDYDETTKAIGYDLDVDLLQTTAQSFLVSLPGYSGLVDSFRVTVDPILATPDVGNERIAILGISLVLSERAAKRSRTLATGKTVEA